MKSLKFACVCVAVCLLGVASSAQVLKRTTTKTDEVPFGAGSTLAIAGAPVGNVKVWNSTTNTVTIEATIEVQAANEADLAGAATLTGFVVQETLGRVAIVSVGADSRRKFTSEEKKLIKRLKGMPYRIDYSIGIPRYANIEIDGGKGEIHLYGAEGHNRINGLDSDVRVNVSGGDLAINLAKGRVHIEVPRSGFRGSGITAAVVSGQIALFLANGVSADVEASVLRTGQIFSKEAVDLKPRDARKYPFTDKLVMARAGAGGVGIKLTVGDGDIWLSRLVE